MKPSDRRAYRLSKAGFTNQQIGEFLGFTGAEAEAAAEKLVSVQRSEAHGLPDPYSEDQDEVRRSA